MAFILGSLLFTFVSQKYYKKKIADKTLAKIGEGITSLINRFRPAPSIPRVNINDLTTGGCDFTGATTGTGQDVSAGDLTSIGDTGFSEYSSPETASQYEGSF